METVHRTSKKRQAIYNALCATTAHPSAEQLYTELKPSIPDLSLGTVYRNLGVLMSDGLVISVGNVDGEERYDARTESHTHFICEKCSAVLDVWPKTSVPVDYAEIEACIGGKVRSHSLSFTGICEKCSKLR